MEGHNPFSDDDSFQLPNDFIVDMILPVSAGASFDPTQFYISQVGVFSSGVSIAIAYMQFYRVFALVNIPVTNFVEYSSYPIVGFGDMFDSVGTITIGKLETIMKYPGAWSFSGPNIYSTQLVPTVIRPNLRAVSSIRVSNQGDEGDPLTGDIILASGSNYRLDVSGNTIIFNAVSGDNMTEPCQCTNIDRNSPPIRSINGVIPDQAGNINLYGTSCLSIAAGQYNLTLSDTCSKPCCGCQELNVLTSTLDNMNTQMLILENAAARLDTTVGVINARTK